MRNAIFITVRTDSTRLPQKALLKILDRPIIELVILRAKQVKDIDRIVLCTTEQTNDDILVEIAKINGVDFYRGSAEDKLVRWLGATKMFDIDYFVTMDGDDLFCDPELMKLSIKQMEKENCDFIKAPQGLICGAFTYCIRTTALEKVCSIKDTSDTEMMWVYFENTGLFKVSDLDALAPIFYDNSIRLTLDYPEDFHFFTRVFEHFQCENNDVPLRDIISFLKQYPEVAGINILRQEDYLNNQKRKVKLILKEE